LSDFDAETNDLSQEGTPSNGQFVTGQGWTRRPLRPNSPYTTTQPVGPAGPRFRGGAPIEDGSRDNHQADLSFNRHKMLVVPSADTPRIFIPTTVRQSIRLAAHAEKEATLQLCVEAEPHSRALEHSNTNEGADLVQPTHAAA